MAERLSRERPVPRAGFRAQLRSRLMTAAARRGVAPERLRLLIGAYAGCGVALLLVVAVGLAGAGPLSA